MVWSQLKQHARRLIIYSSQPSKVVNLICEACDWKIIENKWKNDAGHIIKRNSSFHLLDGVDTDKSEVGLFKQRRESYNASNHVLKKKQIILQPQFLKKTNFQW